MTQTNVITLKTQAHAVNARWKRLCKRSLNGTFSNKCHLPSHLRFAQNLLKLTGPLVNFNNTLQAVFLHWFPIAKKLHTQTVSTAKLRTTILYKKAAYKMLSKLALGPNTQWELLMQDRSDIGSFYYLLFWPKKCFKNLLLSANSK